MFRIGNARPPTGIAAQQLLAGVNLLVRAGDRVWAGEVIAAEGLMSPMNDFC